MTSLPSIPAPPAAAAPEAASGAGYPASAPDLGRIQEAMRAALSSLPPHLLRQSWRQRGIQWGWNFLKVWVQGLRRADLELHGGRIDVRMITAGPGGQYEYAFTVRLRGSDAAGTAPSTGGSECPT